MSPFCHIVIPAPDLAAAKRFYEAVFGWEIQENVPGPKYWFFKSGNVGGAFDGNRTGAARAFMAVVAVEDMDAALARIVENGGKITQARSAIGDASPGFDAYFLDPNGNEMGVYSSR